MFLLYKESDFLDIKRALCEHSAEYNGDRHRFWDQSPFETKAESGNERICTIEPSGRR